MADLHLVQHRLLIVTPVFLTVESENLAAKIRLSLLLQRDPDIRKMPVLQQFNHSHPVVRIYVSWLLAELGIKA